MPKRPFRSSNLNNTNGHVVVVVDDDDNDDTGTTTTTTIKSENDSGTPTSSSFVRAPSSIRFMMIVLGSLVVFVALLLLKGESKLLTNTSNNLAASIASTVLKQQQPQPQRQQRQRRLGDDCLLVFLDVGSNIGVHNRFLMEPLRYPDAAAVITGVFDKAFGSHTIRDNRDICAFGFEPNPIHRPRQQALQSAYRRMGWRYTFVGAGVSDRNGNLTFYHKTDDSHKEEWGFSMVQESPEEIPEVVPIVHLTEWIRHHIAERTLPKTIYGDYMESTQQQGKVVMKLDIEGEEFHVLPNLLTSGIFCSSLDVVFGEYHPDTAHLFNRFAPTPPADANNNMNIHDRDRQGQLQIGDGQDAMRYFNGMMRVVTSVDPKDCRGRWINLDDEHYLHDGVPFPEPPQPTTTTTTP